MRVPTPIARRNAGPYKRSPTMSVPPSPPPRPAPRRPVSRLVQGDIPLSACRVLIPPDAAAEVPADHVLAEPLDDDSDGCSDTELWDEEHQEHEEDEDKEDERLQLALLRQLNLCRSVRVAVAELAIRRDVNLDIAARMLDAAVRAHILDPIVPVDARLAQLEELKQYF
jgi:hypothetical protein